MEMREVYSEKVRAALTRKEPAIRDLFDLFHAVRKMHLDLDDHDFLIMVREKLEIPGNTPVDISLAYKRELNRQLEGQLEPVLRPAQDKSVRQAQDKMFCTKTEKKGSLERVTPLKTHWRPQPATT
jgi:hypothetical protein